MPLVRKSSSSAPPPPPPIDENALRFGSREQRWAAARASTDVGALGRALARETDNAVREALLSSLCRIGTSEAASLVVPGVRNEDAGVRRGALDALISMPAAALPHLPALLADADPDVRLLSCEIVRALPAEQATELLAPLLLVEAVPNVCTAAVDVLTEIGTPDAEPALRAVSARFPEEAFLQFAVNAALDRLTDTGRA